MNFYFYVCNSAKGRFLAAMVNERHAVEAVAKALVSAYPDWQSVKVYMDHPFQTNSVILYHYTIPAKDQGIPDRHP